MAIHIQQLTPAFAIHPGEMLKDELEARVITQKEFATLTGIQISQLNEIIKGKRGISADIALVVGKALSMEASIWLNLQNNYELDVAKINTKTSARLEALDQWEMIKPYVPWLYYKKMGALQGNPVVDIAKVKDIYNVNSLDSLIAVYSQTNYARFRKSDKLTVDKINLVGWVKLINYKAALIKVPKFSSTSQMALIAELQSVLKKNKNIIEKTVEVLAQHGIKLVVLAHPEKCAVDGISFWSNGNPSIGISLRHKRIDNFAFTIMHELGHVYLHLVNNNTAEFIDIEDTQHSKDYKSCKEELEADAFARNSFIDEASWKDFMSNNSIFSEINITAFANKLKVHPAIVLGRYCFEKQKFAFKTKIDKSLK